jgi:hypothetical protein
MSVIKEGDVGAIITINLGTTNIPVTSTIYVVVENPFGATAEWTLESGELNKTTGIITHKTKVGEVPYSGEYRMECRQVDTSTTPNIDLHSGVDYFKVVDHL